MAVVLAPSGNPATVATRTGDPPIPRRQRNPIGIHAHGGESVLASFLAEPANVSRSRLRFQQGVVDQGGDLADGSL